MKRISGLSVFLLCLVHFVMAQDAAPKEILLWPNGAPGSEGKVGVENVRVTDQGDHVLTNIHRPSITTYLPSAEKNSGTAIIVIPGGGHSELWITHEGYNPAQWFADRGIAA